MALQKEPRTSLSGLRVGDIVTWSESGPHWKAKYGYGPFVVTDIYPHRTIQLTRYPDGPQIPLNILDERLIKLPFYQAVREAVADE